MDYTPPLFIRFVYEEEAKMICDEFKLYVTLRNPLAIDTTNLSPEELPVQL